VHLSFHLVIVWFYDTASNDEITVGLGDRREQAAVWHCVATVCVKRHTERHDDTRPKKGCYPSGFRTLRLTLVRWGPRDFTESGLTETVNGDETSVHGSGILWCDAVSLDECLSTFRTVVMPSSSGSTIHVTHEDVHITTLRNVGKYTASHSRRPESLATPLWEPACMSVLDVLQVSLHCVLAEWQQAQVLFVCLDVRFLLMWPQCHNKVAGQYTQMSCHYRDCTHVQSNIVLCTEQYLGNKNFSLNVVDNSLINFCSSLLSLAAGGWW
jgi:hypothetical protein